jgi:PII-like signaling protein
LKTYKKKQLTIICELPLASRVIKTLTDAGVTGYTQFDAASGRGSEGPWNRDGLVGASGRMVMIVTILSVEDSDNVLPQIYELIEPQMAIATIADVEVLRDENF